MRKQIQQAIKSENLFLLESTEPGTITFKVESLICKILSYNSNSHQVSLAKKYKFFSSFQLMILLQSLHLILEPDGAFSHHWFQDSVSDQKYVPRDKFLLFKEPLLFF